MTDALTLLFGPLAAPECSRAARRGWLIWVRMLPAIAAGAAAFVAVWVWSIGHQIDPSHQPFTELRFALTAIEGLMVAAALILSPAVLAGSLAGEKERGSIGLLLTTRVGSADIVRGRLAAGISQLAMIELAILPALLLIATLAGLGWPSLIALVAMPAAVAFGGGGVALAASSMSRRGRDALLFVYLFDILFLLSPVVAAYGSPWIGSASPFETIVPLTWSEAAGPSWATSAIWALMGAVGLVLASRRLRPSCLAEADGSSKARKSAKRRGWVPQLDERPMLWKELHIERVGTLGRAGRWIGGLLVLWLGLGSLALAGVAAWSRLTQVDPSWLNWAIQQSSAWYGGSAVFIGWLIQWAIGLRAAVTISSERERGTWDALLTSPLEGTEIVRGKLWGSLYALKWLIGSALLAWTIAFALGGMFLREYGEQIAGLAVVGPFMAAVGVRTSLRSATATRAMGVTIGIWLGAYVAVMAVAWILCIGVTVACVLAWLYSIQLGLATFTMTPVVPMSFRLGMDLLFCAEFAAATVLIVAETHLRFDRVAGRMTGGAAAVAVDRLIHGLPMAPVRIDGKPKVPLPELDEVAR